MERNASFHRIQPILLILIYALMSLTGFGKTQSALASLWAVTGLGLSALWLWGLRAWPVVTAGTMVSGAMMFFLKGLTNWDTFLWGTLIAFARAGAIVAGYSLLKRWRVSPYPFRSLKETSVWAGGGVLLTPLLEVFVSLLLMLPIQRLTGTTPPPWEYSALPGTPTVRSIGFIYSITNMAGVLAIFPLAIHCLSPRAPQRNQPFPKKWGVIVLLAWAFTWLVFNGTRFWSALAAYRLDYILLTLVLIAPILVSDRRFNALTMFGMSLIALLATNQGHGPLVSRTPAASFWLWGTYVSLATSITLGFTAGAEQRAAAERDLTEKVVELEKHNHRMALLNDIIQTALQATSETEMLQTLADQLGALWQADGCYLTLWDDISQSALPAAACGHLREEYRQMRIQPTETTLTESVLKMGKVIFIPDVFDSPHLSPSIAHRFPARSILAIPLIASQQWLGAALVAFDTPLPALPPEELEWAELVGGQVALALEKVALYQRVVNALHQERQLAALAQAFISDLDIYATMRSVTELLADLANADAGALALLTEDGQSITYPYLTDNLPAELKEEKVSRGEQSLIWPIVDGRQPLLLDDYGAHPQASPHWAGLNIQAFLGVPILAREKCIGAIGLFRHKGKPPFTPQSLTLITSVGNQAGLAIQNAMLYRQEKILRQRAEVLQEIALDLTGTLDLQQILRRLMEHMRSLVPYGSASIFLLTKYGLRLVNSQGLPLPGDVDGRFFPADDPLFAEIRSSGQPLSLNTPAEHPAFQGWGGTQRLCHWLGVPLKQRDEVIGYITLDRYEYQPYTDEEISLAETIANHAAAAISQARLFTQTEQHAREWSVLFELSRQFTHQVEPERIAYLACHLAIQHLNASCAWVGLLPAGEKTLRLTAFDHQALQESSNPEQVHELHNTAQELTEQPLMFRAAQSGVPVLIEDTAADGILDAENRDTLHKLQIHKLAAFSLRHAGQVLGVLVLGSGQEDIFVSERLGFLQSFASQLAVALENARLFADTQRHLEYLQALHTIDMTINSSLDLEVTLGVLVRQLVSQLQVDAVAIFVLEPLSNMLTYQGGEGFRATRPFQERFRLGQGRAGRIALTRQPIYIADLREKEAAQSYTAALIDEEGFVSYYGAPLIAKGQVKGVLEVYHREVLRPTPQWMEFLNAVTAQAAIAMESATLFKNLERSNFDLLMAYNTTLEGWSRALELRDAETEGHSERVTEMTLRLARTMGISGEKLVHIRRGALLHDIGKMGIPDSILYKPGPLDDDEWEIMRKHPVYAYQLLSPIPYLRPALEIPYCHHERWLGQGYPRGLKGEQIPLAARIFAVVDVWDALSKDRPYRKAWPPEKVRRYIREQAGIQFDPKIVQVFLRMLDREGM